MNRKTISFVLTILFLCVLIPSVILLGLSSWVPDDYNFALPYRNEGINALFLRIFSWSPRPISELILYIYYGFVDQNKEAYVSQFLLMLWIFFGASIYLGLNTLVVEGTDVGLSESHQHTNFKSGITKFFYAFLSKFPSLFPLSLIVFFYFIFISKPSEVFYVPVVSAAYLPTISGVILITCTMLKVLNSQRIRVFDFTLLLACGIMTSFSSEVGSFYLFFLSFFLFFLTICHYFKPIPTQVPVLFLNGVNSLKFSIINFIYFLLPSLVFFSLSRSRLGKAELSSLDSPVAGNLKASMNLAFQKFIEETFLLAQTSFDNKSVLVSFSYAILIKLLFVILVVTLLIQSKLSLIKSGFIYFFILISTLFITNFIVILASYYQFGELCCDRHLHFRSMSIGLSLLLVGIAIASKLSSKFNTVHDDYAQQKKTIFTKLSSSRLGFLILLVASIFIVLLVNLQVKSINNDIKHFLAISKANKENWEANIKLENSSGEFHNFPHPQYAVSFGMPPGIYTLKNKEELFYIPSTPREDLTPGESHQVKSYMRYFQKNKLVVH